MKRTPNRARLVLEGSLWATALCCALSFGWIALQAHGAQKAAAGIAAAEVGSASALPASSGAPSLADVRTPAAAQVIGRLEIPKLALSVPMMADFDNSSLLRGVGHIHGTAVPGGLGNLVLAGHRDTYFRPLRRIAPGMEIRVADGSGTFHYVVDSTEVVIPEEVRILSIGGRPELTLITCYPFNYIGAAPKRFIVHAHLLSLLADGQ